MWILTSDYAFPFYGTIDISVADRTVVLISKGLPLLLTHLALESVQYYRAQTFTVTVTGHPLEQLADVTMCTHGQLAGTAAVKLAYIHLYVHITSDIIWQYDSHPDLIENSNFA